MSNDIKVLCKKCGSDNTKVSHSMSTGIVFRYKDTIYKRCRQIIKCNNCKCAYVVMKDEIYTGDPPDDLIDFKNRVYNMELPILRNVSPKSICEELEEEDVR